MTFFKTIFGSKSSTSDKIEVLDKETYKKRIAEKDVQLVDVRTPKEYKNGLRNLPKKSRFTYIAVRVNAVLKPPRS
ncbi:hypothetical protein [uncultured Eudoraea sp.]|uniref:hypothetical protein n=1 Tax=uncultured Eudoraea sp. TaxID=1035614 RepID=UPI00345B71AD